MFSLEQSDWDQTCHLSEQPSCLIFRMFWVQASINQLRVWISWHIHSSFPWDVEANANIVPISTPTDATCDRFLFLSICMQLYMFRASSAHHQEPLTVHAVSSTVGTGSFPGVKRGRGVLLTTHPLLAPRSWKSKAIPLLPSGPQPGL
jgi:hypothetical protein